MLWYIPNILTFSRLVLTVIFLVMILCTPSSNAESRTQFLDVAFVIFVTAGITDLVDGPIARRLNVTSKFGRMIDPLADKILVCGTFVCFAIIGEPKLFGFSTTTLAIIHWAIAAILIAREAYVTTLRHIAEARGVDFAATMSGKIKMCAQTLAIGTVVVKMAHVQTAAWGYWFTTATFAVMLAVTVVSGIWATQRPSWKQATV